MVLISGRSLALIVFYAFSVLIIDDLSREIFKAASQIDFQSPAFDGIGQEPEAISSTLLSSPLPSSTLGVPWEIGGGSMGDGWGVMGDA